MKKTERIILLIYVATWWAGYMAVMSATVSSLSMEGERRPEGSFLGFYTFALPIIVSLVVSYVSVRRQGSESIGKKLLSGFLLALKIFSGLLILEVIEMFLIVYFTS